MPQKQQHARCHPLEGSGPLGAHPRTYLVGQDLGRARDLLRVLVRGPEFALRAGALSLLDVEGEIDTYVRHPRCYQDPRHAIGSEPRLVWRR